MAGRPAFPFDLHALRVWLAGDEQARAAFTPNTAWLREGNSDTFLSGTDIAFLRENWDGPVVLKRIQTVQGAHVGGIHRVKPWYVSGPYGSFFMRLIEPCALHRGSWADGTSRYF